MWVHFWLRAVRFSFLMFFFHSVDCSVCCCGGCCCCSLFDRFSIELTIFKIFENKILLSLPLLRLRWKSKRFIEEPKCVFDDYLFLVCFQSNGNFTDARFSCFPIWLTFCFQPVCKQCLSGDGFWSKRREKWNDFSAFFVLFPYEFCVSNEMLTGLHQIKYEKAENVAAKRGTRKGAVNSCGQPQIVAHVNKTIWNEYHKSFITDHWPLLVLIKTIP